MTDPDHPPQHLRFARTRRLKFLLRFVPRRARFHTYPLVGRFASFARARSYLWSFRYPDMRPAFYAGSVLALMPAMGVQLPIGFALCLLLRTNFMVMGGLQFITNPATFWAVYPITYQVGRFVISNVGLGASPEPEALPPGFSFAPGAAESGAHEEGVLGDNDEGVPRTAWTSRLGTAFNALLLGGLILGTVLGGILDLLWRWLVLPAAKLRAARKPVTAIITPHEPPPPPPTES